MRFGSKKIVAAALMMSAVGLAAGCGDGSTGPEFQVIEEVEFAASLDVDLSAMQRLGSGVYVQDLTVGGGESVVRGSTPSISFTGWLVDGFEFTSDSVTFLMGNDNVIRGLEDGLLNQRVGGVRRMIIPPNRGFGGLEERDPITGELVVPAGSVLVYEVEVTALAGG